MDLFNHRNQNLLPYEGEVFYFGPVLNSDLASVYYHTLLDEIEWRHDEAFMFGKHIITKRKVAWYGSEQFSYTYSNVTKTALPWTDTLKELKTIAENTTKETYNSCLLNLYHDGSETMGYHSDGEKDLKKHGAIASMSFGAERKFAFKHKKTKDTVNIILQHGSLLVMRGTTQDNWLHRLPPTKKITTPRVNLTFRTIIRPEVS